MASAMYTLKKRCVGLLKRVSMYSTGEVTRVLRQRLADIRKPIRNAMLQVRKYNRPNQPV